MTHRERIEQYLREGRTVSGGKGGHSSHEQAAADQLRQQEFNLMQQQLQSVNQVLNPLIAQGGMNPQQQAAMTSIALNDIPQQFRAVQGDINSSLVARGITGGQMAGSGDIARQFGSLGAMEAGLQQQSLSNIQLAKQQQLMQALGLKLGLTGTFNQGTLGALGSGVTAAGNADMAQSSFMGSLVGGLASLGSPFATAGAGKIPCWVARAVYGDTAWQVPALLSKLYRWAESSYLGRLVLAVYIVTGEPAAHLIKRSRSLNIFVRKVLDRYA